MNGACAFADGALFLAGSFAAWATFAVTGVALDGAIASAFGAVFHVCVVSGRIVRAILEAGGVSRRRMGEVSESWTSEIDGRREGGREKGEGERVRVMQTVVLILILGKQWASNEQNDERCFLFRISTTKLSAHTPSPVQRRRRLLYMKLALIFLACGGPAQTRCPLSKAPQSHGGGRTWDSEASSHAQPPACCVRARQPAPSKHHRTGHCPGSLSR